MEDKKGFIFVSIVIMFIICYIYSNKKITYTDTNNVEIIEKTIQQNNNNNNNNNKNNNNTKQHHELKTNYEYIKPYDALY